jgi:hypothetical protein
MEANDNKKYSNWTTTSSSMYAAPSVHADGKSEEKHSPKLVYGLKGLADFLHQSITTAWRLKKSGKFDAAISQRGRCIITDTDKLLELMRLDQVGKNSNYIPYYNY